MPVTTEKTWSAPHCDITHYGQVGDRRRSSITSFSETRHQLARWHRGCGFNPDTENYDSLEAAKRAGEEWVNSH